MPDGFVFSVKGPRFATNRRVLAEAGNSIKRFLDSGVLELRDRLGPMLWQFAPTKKFDAGRFRKIPRTVAADGGRAAAAPRRRGPPSKLPHAGIHHAAAPFAMPVVFTDHATYPSIADVTGDFVYARLQKGVDTIPTAYPAKELDAWAGRLRAWAQGKAPDDLPRVEAAAKPKAGAARRVRLRHSRRQGAGAGGGDGADRAAREIKKVPPPREARRGERAGWAYSP